MGTKKGQVRKTARRAYEPRRQKVKVTSIAKSVTKTPKGSITQWFVRGKVKKWFPFGGRSYDERITQRIEFKTFKKK